MRKKIYQIARSYQIGYYSIFLDCELDIAIDRNNKRIARDKVDIKSIMNLYNNGKT